MSEAATSIYQLRLVLRHVTPVVWRRVLVCSDTTIAQLHRVIQVTMGWDDLHLHRFRIHGKDYGSGCLGSTCTIDPHTVTLASLRLRPRERFAYHYDFIAGWQHDILWRLLASSARSRPSRHPSNIILIELEHSSNEPIVCRTSQRARTIRG